MLHNQCWVIEVSITASKSEILFNWPNIPLTSEFQRVGIRYKSEQEVREQVRYYRADAPNGRVYRIIHVVEFIDE